MFVSGKFNCLFIKETQWKGTLIPNDNKHALQSKETAMLKDQPLNFVNSLPELELIFLRLFLSHDFNKIQTLLCKELFCEKGMCQTILTNVLFVQ